MTNVEKAKELVLGDRNKDYGNPREDFMRIAKSWSGLLGSKLTQDITPEEAILMMAMLKICREVHLPKQDNIIDFYGYGLCYEWALTGKRP